MTLNTEIKFFVPGIPAPGGSKNTYINKVTGKVCVVDACKRNKPWRDRVASFAMPHRPKEPVDTAIQLSIDFYLPRPKYHYGTGKNSDKVKQSAPKFCKKKPDSTKLTRALEDALTGIIWRDDAQVVKQIVRKHWSASPGALVTIVELE